MGTKKENQKIIDKVDRKVIDEKAFHPIEILERKTKALYVKLQLKRVGLKMLRLKFER